PAPSSDRLRRGQLPPDRPVPRPEPTRDRSQWSRTAREGALTLDDGRRLRVGVDIGGTFTDLVVVRDDGSVLTRKLPSTPDDYGRAIVEGLEALQREHGLDPAAIVEVVHGTTVATNAI